MPHKIKKQFGQNFLTDKLIKDRIIRECHLTEEDTILEIGPGQGAITELIAPRVKKLIAVETDKDLIAPLKEKLEGSNVELIHQDILTFDLNTLPDHVKIISNLPYNIATPIIENVILHKHKFTDFYMTVQLEYGKRLTAQPNSKSYGSLSCFIDYHTQTEILFRISNKAFTPQPKVQSCFCRMHLLPKPKTAANDEKLLFQIIKSAFAGRRKTIINSMGTLIDKDKLKDVLTNIGIDAKTRAENLSLDDYIAITNALA